MKTLTYILCTIMIVAGLGCAAMSHYVTPASINTKAVDYAVEAGVVEPNDFSGYQNLEKAIRLELAVKNAYEVNSLALQQMAEKNQLDYNLLNDLVVRNVELARQREEMLFSESGLLAMGLSLAGVGGFTGLIGLMRKRPGDLTPAEQEQVLGTIKGEVTNKERQILELVRGVQAFLDVEDTGAAQHLKTKLASAQSADTKETVARIKTTL